MTDRKQCGIIYRYSFDLKLLTEGELKWGKMCMRLLEKGQPENG